MISRIIILLFAFNFGFANAQTDSIRLVSFELSECLGQSCKIDYRFKVASETILKDSLFLQLDGYANCGGVHDVGMYVENDTIKLSFKQGGYVDEPIYFAGLLDVNELGDTIEIHDSIAGYYKAVNSFMCDCPFLYSFVLTGVDSTIKYGYMINDEFIYSYSEIKLLDNRRLRGLEIPELDSCLEVIAAHPEIMKYKTDIEQDSDHERELHIIISARRDNGKYHWVEVIESQGNDNIILQTFRIIKDPDFYHSIS